MPWGQPPAPIQGGPAAPSPERPGGAWLVVLPIGIAVVLLALVAFGLRAAGGRTETTKTVEVPSRIDPLPSTTSPTSTAPGASPSTTRPGGPTTTTPDTSGTTTPTLDTTTPRVKVSDTDGRFDVTVPRSWVSLPGIVPDAIAWQLFEQDADGDPVQTEFQFVVAWFAAEGCSLDRCAAQQVDRMTAAQPTLSPKSTRVNVAGRPAVRLDAVLPPRRLVDWVVVEGDRYWVVHLIGPSTGFDEVLSAVQPVLATMSFG